MRTNIFFWVVVTSVSLSSGCGESQSQLPPEKATVSGTVSLASGLNPANYDFYDTVGDTATPVAADGSFAGESAGRQSGFLMAVPREDTPSGKGLYLSPAPGVFRITAKQEGSTLTYGLDDSGNARMDATTTVLSLLLQHPMLAHPWPVVQQQQAKWLVGKVNKGWPSLQSAQQAYDAALSSGRDPISDTAFTSAFTACLNELADMPEPEKPDSSLVSLEQGLSDSSDSNVKVDVAKIDIYSSDLQEKSRDATRVSFKATTANGTGLDYLVIVGEVPDSQAHMQNGIPDLKSINAMAFRPDKTYAIFVPASSYFGYLNIFGNAIKWVSTKLSLDTLNMTPPNTTMSLPGKKVYEVRFFSGGLLGGNEISTYTFVSQWYAEQAHNAFMHNVFMALWEAISLIPGAKVFMSDETVTGAIVDKVLMAAVPKIEALMHSKPVDQLTKNDLYVFMCDLFRVAIDELKSQIAKAPKTEAWKKLLSYFEKGGQEILNKIAIVPGLVAKGGEIANRAASLVRPPSIMEYWTIAVGYGGTDAGTPTPGGQDASAPWVLCRKEVESSPTILACHQSPGNSSATINYWCETGGFGATLGQYGNDAVCRNACFDQRCYSCNPQVICYTGPK